MGCSACSKRRSVRNASAVRPVSPSVAAQLAEKNRIAGERSARAQGARLRDVLRYTGK